MEVRLTYPYITNSIKTHTHTHTHTHTQENQDIFEVLYPTVVSNKFCTFWFLIWLFFKIFFVWKYIKIIFFNLLFQIYFNINILKWLKNKKLYLSKIFLKQKKTTS